MLCLKVFAVNKLNEHHITLLNGRHQLTAINYLSHSHHNPRLNEKRDYMVCFTEAMGHPIDLEFVIPQVTRFYSSLSFFIAI